MYTTNDQQADVRRLREDLRADEARPGDGAPLPHHHGARLLRINFYPHYNTTASNDPIMWRLNKVRCAGATGATGVGDKTLIRIKMYGWNGARGRYLADKVAELSGTAATSGCSHSDGGGYVVGKIRANGVPCKTASYDRNDNGTVDVYTHEKYMILSRQLGRKRRLARVDRLAELVRPSP